MLPTLIVITKLVRICKVILKALPALAMVIIWRVTVLLKMAQNHWRRYLIFLGSQMVILARQPGPPLHILEQV